MVVIYGIRFFDAHRSEIDNVGVIYNFFPKNSKKQMNSDPIITFIADRNTRYDIMLQKQFEIMDDIFLLDLPSNVSIIRRYIDSDMFHKYWREISHNAGIPLAKNIIDLRASTKPSSEFEFSTIEIVAHKCVGKLYPIQKLPFQEFYDGTLIINRDNENPEKSEKVAYFVAVTDGPIFLREFFIYRSDEGIEKAFMIETVYSNASVNTMRFPLDLKKGKDLCHRRYGNLFPIRNLPKDCYMKNGKIIQRLQAN